MAWTVDDVPADWPGHPRTPAGLASALRKLAPHAAAIHDAYLEWLPVNPGQTAMPQAAQEIILELAWTAYSIPQVLLACEQITAPPPPGRIVDDTAQPLLIPDDATQQLVPIGPGSALPVNLADLADRDRLVSWWPLAPPGVHLGDAPPEAVDPRGGSASRPWLSGGGSPAVITSPAMPPPTIGAKRRPTAPPDPAATAPSPWDPPLVGYAATLTELRQGHADYYRTYQVLVGFPGVRAAVRRAHSTATAYQRWLRVLENLADQLVTAWVERIHQLRQGYAALVSIEQGTNAMPALISTPAVVADLAKRISAQITAGHGGRLQVSDDEAAFSWAVGLPTTLVSYLASGLSTGRHVDTVTANDSGASTASVAEGGAKPDGVVFTEGDLNLVKFASTALLTTESAQFVANIEQAVASVLSTRLLRGIEGAAVTAMQAAAGVTVAAAADITAGVLEGIAGIAGHGGTATVVGLSAVDWVTIMSQQGSAGGYVNFGNPEQGPGATWMGLGVALVPTLATGSAIVADGRSTVVYEVPGGPLCIVDMGSAIGTNKLTIAVETWAGPNVNSPGGVAKVTVGAAAGREASKK